MSTTNAKHSSNIGSMAHNSGLTTADPYKWQPLLAADQIRLLFLQPGMFDDDIEVNIQVTDAWQWRSEFSYTALSYFCGPPVLNHCVICDNQRITVTRRLDLALRYLRLQKQHRVLWIDALCIDQANTDERNAQILLMHEIYRNAQEVVGWVGEISEEVKGAVMLGGHEKGTISGHPEETSVEVCLKLAECIPKQGLREFFVGFFQREWFTRTWMIQEVALARQLNLQLGSLIIYWDDAMRLLHTLCDRILYEASDLRLFKGLHNALRMEVMRNKVRSGQAVDIRDAFHHSRSFQATDPRDRLYSLRGMTQTDVRRIIVPNYHDHHDSVFRDTTRSLILHMGNLEWLSFARPVFDTVDLLINVQTHDGARLSANAIQNTLQRRTLPTWAVDWTHDGDSDHDESDPNSAALKQLDTPEHKYRAAGESKIRTSDDGDPAKLILDGRRVGQIQSCARGFQQSAAVHVGRNFPERPMEHNFLMAYSMCIASALSRFSHKIYAPTNEPIHAATWRTLVGNRWSIPGLGVRGEGEIPPAHMEKWFGRWIELMKAADPTQRHRWSQAGSDRYFYELYQKSGGSMGPTEQDEMFPANIVWRSMGEAIMCRCFCIIGDQYMGLGPPTAKEGDVVVVLYGGNVAYVLRPLESESINTMQSAKTRTTPVPNKIRHWQYVGEAYVHGCMDGEVFENDSVVDEVFQLV